MMMNFEVIPMTASYIPAVAQLHGRVFPGSRSTKLGNLYLKKMFRWFLTYQPGLTLIAIQDQNVIGYVVGAIGGYGRKLFRFALVEVIIGLILHPGLWFEKGTFLLWRSYLKGLLPKRKKGDPPKDHARQSGMVSAALAGIGVEGHHQGQGIGKALLRAFEDAANDLGVQKLTLSVRNENKRARCFYDRSGWVVDGEDQAANTVHYNKIIS